MSSKGETMTEERARLRALESTATPGPWTVGAGGHGEADVEGPRGTVLTCWPTRGRQDAAFIAAARSAVPRLLDALDTAEECSATAPSGGQQRVDAATVRLQPVREALGMTAAPAKAEPVIRAPIPGAPALAEVTIPPGGSLPREVHPKEDETIYVVSGRAFLMVKRHWEGQGTSDDAYALWEGEAARVSAGKEHSLSNVGEEPLRVLVMVTPTTERAEFNQADVERMIALGDPDAAPPLQGRMTPEQEERQRQNFVYGNVKMANDQITREMIDEAADGLAAERGAALRERASPTPPPALLALLARGTLPCGHAVSELKDGSACGGCRTDRHAHWVQLDESMAKYQAQEQIIRELHAHVARVRELQAKAESERMSAHAAACADRDRAVTAEETLARWREKAAPLVQAIRRITGYSRSQQDPCERCKIRHSAFGNLCPECDCDEHGDRAELETIRQDGLKTLCVAAEAFFGGDFRAPEKQDG